MSRSECGRVALTNLMIMRMYTYRASIVYVAGCRTIQSHKNGIPIAFPRIRTLGRCERLNSGLLTGIRKRKSAWTTSNIMYEL